MPERQMHPMPSPAQAKCKLLVGPSSRLNPMMMKHRVAIRARVIHTTLRHGVARLSALCAADMCAARQHRAPPMSKLSSIKPVENQTNPSALSARPEIGGEWGQCIVCVAEYMLTARPRQTHMVAIAPTMRTSGSLVNRAATHDAPNTITGIMIARREFRPLWNFLVKTSATSMRDRPQAVSVAFSFAFRAQTLRNAISKWL